MRWFWRFLDSVRSRLDAAVAAGYTRGLIRLSLSLIELALERSTVHVDGEIFVLVFRLNEAW